MPNYQNSKIYKITSGNLIYIGSTTAPTLAHRLAEHVSVFKQWKKGNHNNVTSFQLIETGQYEIILIELFPCGSKDELHARERFHIENTICVNKFIPNRTQKEWDKEYRETHKELIKEKRSIKYTCECGSICNFNAKAQHNRTKKHINFKTI